MGEVAHVGCDEQLGKGRRPLGDQAVGSEGDASDHAVMLPDEAQVAQHAAEVVPAGTVIDGTGTGPAAAVLAVR